MKAKLLIGGMALIAATLVRAATNDFTGALQKGLFEEEANRNLDAAIQAYQSVAARFDKDRQLASTAIFRLGECYRKLGKTNEAVVQYERIVREFSDQQTLVTLSRQNLGGLSSVVTSTGLQNTIADEQEVGRLETELLDTRARARRIADRVEGYNSAKNFEDMLTFVSDEALKELFRKNTELARKFESLKASRDKDDPELATATKQFDESQQLLESADKRYQDSLDLQLRGLTAKAAALQDRLDLAWGLTTVAGPRAQDAALLERLKKLSQAEARQLLPTLVPDELLTRLLGQYQATEAKRAQEANNYGPDHPEMRSLDNLLKKLDEQIKERVDGIIKALEIRVAAASATAGSTGAATQSTTSDDEEKEIRRIREMIKNSPDLVNAKSADGETRLASAAARGQLKVVQFLLDNGADIKGQSRALNLAALNGHKAVVELLLNRGADVNAKDIDGLTALHQAAERGFKSVVEVLLAHKANVNVRNNPYKNISGGQTPLHRAADVGRTEMVELLLSKGADVNAKDSDGATPLVRAVIRKHVPVVKALLAKKAEVNFASSSFTTDPRQGEVKRAGCFPLHFAVEVGDNEILELLLKDGANPNVRIETKDDTGLTPLFQAVMADQKDAVEILLKYKADPNVPNDRGWTPLHVAIQKPEILQQLVDHKAEIDAKDKNGGTALDWAVNNGSKDAARLLLAHGADPNAQNNTGQTTLHVAVSRGNKEMVQLLLANKADVNLADKHGNTPLDLDKQPQGFGRQSIPPPGATPGPRGTANFASEESNRKEIVDLLRQHGALDVLPDFSSIRITPGTLKPIHVFGKDANSLNQFTLFEAIQNYFASGLGPINSPSRFTARLRAIATSTGGSVLSYPDFSRITIYRPTNGKAGERKEITVNILASSDGVDCAKDLPLKFGDVIGIPERDHTLAEERGPLTGQQSQELSKCTERKVRVLVRGETANVTVLGVEADLTSALNLLGVRKILRSSSDLSRVKVRRADSKTGKTKEFLVDTEMFQRQWSSDDLWLRDGDVIEVPDKP